MSTFSRLQPEPPPLAVTVEPLQDDFNYAAYTSRGAEVWPQAYLGDMTPRDPEEVVERVVANGVPRELVVPVLGPGQLDGYEHGQVETVGLAFGVVAEALLAAGGYIGGTIVFVYGNRTLHQPETPVRDALKPGRLDP